MLHYFRVSKNFMHKNDISRFSVDYFLSHSTKKIPRGTLLCFRKILYRNFYAQGGDITTFCWKLLVSKYLKNFVREPFGEQEKLCIEKFYKNGGRREYQDFPSGRFCLTVPKNFVEERFSASLISGI